MLKWLLTRGEVLQLPCTFLQSNISCSITYHVEEQEPPSHALHLKHPSLKHRGNMVLCAGDVKYLSELCSRCRQSEAMCSLRRDSRKRCACLTRAWLGGNRPQQSHSSCQPCSTLNLVDKATDQNICMTP